jgi:hypothetical protein
MGNNKDKRSSKEIEGKLCSEKMSLIILCSERHIYPP